MKSITLALYIVAAVLFMVSFSNAQPELKNFVEVGRTESIMFLVNSKDATVKGSTIFFDGLAAHYKADADGAYALNNQAYVVTGFQIDCNKYTAFKLREKGVWKGDPIDQKYDPPAQEEVIKGRMIYRAIEKVCKDRIGLTAIHEVRHAEGLIL